MKIRHAKVADLPALMRIETSGFTPEEAATEVSMAERIQVIADTFLVANDETGNVQGFIVGPVVKQRYLTDDLFDQVTTNEMMGGFQSVLSLAVSPEAQHQQIGSKLLKQLIKDAKKAQRIGITLTCLERLVPFYELNGFANEGLSNSTHGGEIWYNLVLEF
ncbi:N-acetyltransferase GCN5 [Paucilactobacillus oligofermentans DSM 15707 = LMG 22743]|uniref:N-acetyltransferase GCN5 n=1 Tax=Paucilactobacillus oligofermentans DSM 15707 = LMG 22743 TaxID=1423778 RepID=A0A0R1RQ36_9LACO|nr:GNAT family N-acetyltransferase [Paucilactobacillus oligofermentans]KRL55499.1 N-acetyltransferase GCN5 [Paucilactobacillus oligofermentans DSM 15707 = LMG 22743]CUS25516.1 Putative arylalkylamine n-acetyltransferase [Paucilactobacillus oligofermentans DSM 15707 = LMG 22743]